MCVIAIKPKDISAIPDAAILGKCWDNNPDGAGVMWTDGRGTVQVKKFTKDERPEFEKWDAAAPYRKNPTAYAVGWHFRIGTHGSLTRPNCHPFACDMDPKRIPEEGPHRVPVIMHNGIFTGVKPEGDESDTRAFVRLVMAPFFAKGAHRNTGAPRWSLPLWGAFIGSSRVAIMHQDGRTEMLNEKLGEWSDGIWYSNDAYKRAVRYAGTTATAYQGRGAWMFDDEDGYNHLPYKGMSRKERKRWEREGLSFDAKDLEPSKKPAVSYGDPLKAVGFTAKRSTMYALTEVREPLDATVPTPAQIWPVKDEPAMRWISCTSGPQATTRVLLTTAANAYAVKRVSDNLVKASPNAKAYPGVVCKVWTLAMLTP